ncbi:MAG: nucleotide exchange factor GrpE [Bacteroidetes bacterium]|nr:nucleotide exchange factor GrpE [Bacteroidota bacterium]
MENTRNTEEEQKKQHTEKTPETPQATAEESLQEETAASLNHSEKISELETQISQLKEQLLRKTAEFENYKRRTASESLALTKYASEKILLQLLPVIDDLYRSLKSGEEHLPDDPFVKGVAMIFGKFIKILEAQGLKEMESVGKEFNVDYHDAMMQVPRADVARHTILEEIEKGYLLHDKVLRHAKVIVSTEPVESQEEKK